jgi:2,3-bisphosphoglycerate-independent phosphoglycerate mutase
VTATQRKSVIFIFLDGVGLGRRDSKINPFFAAPLRELRGMLGGQIPSLRHRLVHGDRHTAVPLDAVLGVSGLPQSGTGQTALFTGANGARIAGKHFGPYPYSTLRPVIEKQNIFRRLLEAGKRVCFANAFPERFFEYAARHPGRMTVTTQACAYAGVPLLRDHDLRKGNAISADVTGEAWKTLGYPDMPVISPEEAGRRLARLSRHFDFVLFEYWKTDHAGHSQSMDEAVGVLERLDGILGGIRNAWDEGSTVLVISSDHGNLEDLSTKTHTRHPVPFMVFGDRHRELIHQLERHSGRAPSLCHVTPVLVRYLTAHGGTNQSP